MIKMFFCSALVFITVLQAQVPSWYTQLPEDTTEKFVAVGEGKNSEEAIQHTLVQIASQMNVSVSSTLLKSQEQSSLNGNSSYKEAVEVKMASDVRQFAFNNHKLLKSEFSGGKQYVLISVDKQMLLQERMDQFKQINAKIDSLSHSLDSMSTVVELRNNNQVMSLLPEARALIQIMYAINPDAMRYSAYLSKYTLLEQEIDESMKSTLFVLDVRSSELDFVADILQNAFAQMNIVSTKNVSEQSSLKKIVKLIISGGLKTQKSYGNFSIDARITFSTSENGITGSTITQTLHQDGQIDYKSTLRDLESQMSQNLKADKLFSYIGIR